MESLQTPVVFIVFNRPDLTRTVFEAIAAARPAHLFVIADGPRPSRPDDLARCAEVRRIVTNVTWPCDLRTHFAETNLGCRERIVSGLNWVFSLVPEAIILEDDILPDPTFFPFCAAMLERFRGNDRVSMITGFNEVQDAVKFDDSYFFSQWHHIWGWATWRDAWAQYDPHMTSWPEVRRSGILRDAIPKRRNYQFWLRKLDSVYARGGEWDYPWVYASLIRGALSVVPRTNLVRNLGFGPDATHSTNPAEAPKADIRPLAFPLKHPLCQLPIRALDDLDQRLSRCLGPILPFDLARRVWWRLLKWCNAL